MSGQDIGGRSGRITGVSARSSRRGESLLASGWSAASSACGLSLVIRRWSIQAHLTRAAALLPYVGHGTGVRHVLGSDSGGYEWTSASGPPPRGITALEFDPWGKIERFTAAWKGAYASDGLLTAFAAKAIEY
ncbi:MAG: hypothetical protein ACRDP7_23145 [Trebonia sp.]